MSLNEEPPREMVALAILLADIIGTGTPLSMLNEDGQKNLVGSSFAIADRFLAQIKEKT